MFAAASACRGDTTACLRGPDNLKQCSHHTTLPTCFQHVACWAIAGPRGKSGVMFSGLDPHTDLLCGAYPGSFYRDGQPVKPFLNTCGDIGEVLRNHPMW